MGNYLMYARCTLYVEGLTPLLAFETEPTQTQWME